MKSTSFFISVISSESFLLGFHYRNGKSENNIETHIYEIGIGIMSIGLEIEYK